MRYEARDFANVISIERASKWYPRSHFSCQLHFCQNSLSTRGYNRWFFTILGQNSTHSKIDIIWKVYACWSKWFKFQLCISFL